MLKRVSLGFQDSDVQRARLDADIVNRLNDSAGVTIEVVTPTIADNEFAVRHTGLGKKVTEYQVIRRDTSGNLSRSRPGEWTKAISFFKYSAVSDRILIRLR